MRSFYEWADAHSLLATYVVSRITELKYFAPGTAGGGEHGAMRRVLVEALRSKRAEAPPPRWISDANARNRLGELMLPRRDRFLIDLLTTSGIRVGEALSLFVADLHFGGGSQQLGCRHMIRISMSEWIIQLCPGEGWAADTVRAPRRRRELYRLRPGTPQDP